MREFSLTEKILIGVGATALVAAAAVGVAVVMKNHKKSAKELAEIVCDCEEEFGDTFDDEEEIVAE